MCHPASLCFKLPDNVSLAEGALMEPLAVGLQAVKRGRVSISDQALHAHTYIHTHTHLSVGL